MALILNIESATTSCSVALSQDSRLLALKEINEGYSHAENLHCFIENVFAQAGKKLNELSAVAVSKGPGSYTGLRIGVSAAKGLAYALGIPLIAVDTLQAMSYFAASGVEENATLFPMLDARRMEAPAACKRGHLRGSGARLF
jgi:tRNA threonylcarbamoyladenosine biosynthesis protein TsaB